MTRQRSYDDVGVGDPPAERHVAAARQGSEDELALELGLRAERMGRPATVSARARLVAWWWLPVCRHQVRW